MTSVAFAPAGRGQPLVALTTILVVWTAFRVVSHYTETTSDIVAPKNLVVSDLSRSPMHAFVDTGRTAVRVTGSPVHDRLVAIGPAPFMVRPSMPLRPVFYEHPEFRGTSPTVAPLPQVVSAHDDPPSHRALAPKDLRLAPVEGSVDRTRRWNLDSWLFARPGRMAPLASGATVPSYGSSQLGAVLRYHLAPQQARDPQLYVRAVAALSGAVEQDIGTGVAVRPLTDLPVTVHAELRSSRREDTFDVRPAIFASGGMVGLPLVRGVTVRGYGQAGYIAGREATAFVDGNVVSERTVARFARSEFTVGLGAWGGAQRGAGRADVGPSASLAIPLGNASFRISADYRLRVAGNAQPANGGALTFAVGY